MNDTVSVPAQAESFGTSGENVAAPQQTSPQVQNTMERPEKQLTQDHVNSLVGNVKRTAHERGYSEGYEKARNEFGQTAQTPAPQKSSGALSEEDIRRIAEDQIRKTNQADEEARFQHTTVNTFVNRLVQGSNGDTTFLDRVKQFEFGKMPQLMHIINSVENPKEFADHLMDNPHVAAQFLTMAKETPWLLGNQIGLVNSSIKKNIAGSHQKQANAPIDHLPHESTGTSNGEMKAEDYSKLDWLRT